MEILADADGGVAVVLEVLRQRDGVRGRVAELGREIPDAQGVGPQAGEQRGARRIADGLLAVGVGEDAGTRGEAVEVRRFGKRFDAEIVGGDEQDVRVWETAKSLTPVIGRVFSKPVSG